MLRPRSPRADRSCLLSRSAHGGQTLRKLSDPLVEGSTSPARGGYWWADSDRHHRVAWFARARSRPQWRPRATRDRASGSGGLGPGAGCICSASESRKAMGLVRLPCSRGRSLAVATIASNRAPNSAVRLALLLYSFCSSAHRADDRRRPARPFPTRRHLRPAGSRMGIPSPESTGPPSISWNPPAPLQLCYGVPQRGPVPQGVEQPI